jgi:hypothetical protein
MQCCSATRVVASKYPAFSRRSMVKIFETRYAHLSWGALTLLLGLYLYALRQEQQKLSLELERGRSQLAQARSLLAQREAELKALESAAADSATEHSAATREAHGVSIPEPRSQASSQQEAIASKEEPTHSSEDPQDYSSFAITSELSYLDKLVSLTSEQRERYRRSLQIEHGIAQGERESLADILGPETMQQYRAAQREFRAKAQEEMLESEVFRLSRHLTLTSEQEPQVRELLRQGREQFFPITDESAQEDQKSEPARSPRQRLRDRTRKVLELEAQRQRYNAEALRGVLNDQQYNAYLELQATSAATRSHESFLDTAKQEEEQKKGLEP